MPRSLVSEDTEKLTSDDPGLASDESCSSTATPYPSFSPDLLLSRLRIDPRFNQRRYSAPATGNDQPGSEGGNSSSDVSSQSSTATTPRIRPASHHTPEITSPGEIATHRYYPQKRQILPYQVSLCMIYNWLLACILMVFLAMFEQWRSCSAATSSTASCSQGINSKVLAGEEIWF